ncbi:large-conductance mechanosensitive channel protein MscL [uncultured Ruminococcus sp.]|uniref:large-conductance mechanosensitive channel protein MscL n=1 Tax=uncultured Ruminococcus sp. TaxID=165186 RepID=UPI0026365DDE|nr:large-conductance mechanosensitive channel protein MscL [uncultured Ruminococcus sp.]
MENKNVEEGLKKAGGGLKSVIGEFKEFISKGNVLDMAVGLIVGSAFTAIVTSLVDDILMPFIGTVLAGINFSTLGITIPWGNHPFIAIGNFLNAVITFLLTALCVFIIVKVMNMFRKKEEKKPEPPKPSKEEVLLTEIRDLLAAQQGKPVDAVKKDAK